jgi:superfamily II DNA or RNA helicase
MLSKHGYFIKKEIATPELLEDLTAIPKTDEKFTKIVKKFPIYRETRDGFFIPKSYGITKFGFPKTTKLDYQGKDLDNTIEFTKTLYPHQINIANELYEKCKNNHGAILQLDVGIGKTVIALNVLSRLKGKTIIVVNKISLMEQWKKEISTFLSNVKVATIQGTIDEQQVENCDIAIATIQSLSKKYYSKTIFQNFKTAIVDEIHNTSSEIFSKVFFKICSRYSIGLSATPRRTDGCEKVFLYHIGQIITQPKNQLLGKPVEIKTIKLHDLDYKDFFTLNKRTGEKFLQYTTMISDLVKDKQRNDYIIECIKNVFKDDETTKYEKRKILVLSDRRCHLIELKKLLSQQNVDFSFGLFLGGMKIQELEEAKTKNVILATFSAFGEGVSEKELNTLFLTTPKKFNKDNDSGKLEQIVGRIFRKPHLELNPLIIDFQDMFSIYPHHARLRNIFYKQYFENPKINIVEKHF